jgi:hypothetical protein
MMNLLTLWEPMRFQYLYNCNTVNNATIYYMLTINTVFLGHKWSSSAVQLCKLYYTALALFNEGSYLTILYLKYCDVLPVNTSNNLCGLRILYLDLLDITSGGIYFQLHHMNQQLLLV